MFKTVNGDVFIDDRFVLSRDEYVAIRDYVLADGHRVRRVFDALPAGVLFRVIDVCIPDCGGCGCGGCYWDGTVFEKTPGGLVWIEQLGVERAFSSLGVSPFSSLVAVPDRL